MAMAMPPTSSLLTLLLIIPFFFLLPSLAQNPNNPTPPAFLFPITKHIPTNQYYTPIHISSTTLNAVIDLGGRFLFFNSPHYFNSSSSTYRPILCSTPLCRISDGIGCLFCFLSPPVPGCTNNTCSIDALNPFTGTISYSGLGTDSLRLYSTPDGTPYTLNNFPFQFSLSAASIGLVPPASGILGLGRTRIAIQAQIASAFRIREKFALCLPSDGRAGNLIIGQVGYSGPFRSIASSLYTTPGQEPGQRS